uniref:Tenascin n=1 Tax=Spironucleus salmonicida TaxID=348837 RepID=V6LKF6_9EUKA|eukprot:EST44201.1 Tenascin [Spironucleus salmonicida]
MTCTTDADCGKGECVETKCECYTGYTGENCIQCAEQYISTRQGCLKPCTSKDCGRGYTCTAGILPGKQVCTCSVEHMDPTRGCLHCLGDLQVYDGICVSKTCFQGESLCSGHGICDFDCQCFNEYEGAQCQNCIEGSVKGPNGYCYRQCQDSVQGDHCFIFSQKCDSTLVSGSKLCICQDDNADLDHNCLTCNLGYSKTQQGCVVSSCVFEHKVCNGQGTCNAGVCTCNSGVNGNQCQLCNNSQEIMTQDGKCLPSACVDKLTQTECKGNGTCDMTLKACSCKEGHNGNLCANCDSGYVQSEGSCYKESCYVHKSDQFPCAGNGSCGQDGYCTCGPLSGGIHCEQCRIGFEQVNNGDCVPEECVVDKNQCNNQGHCEHHNNEFLCQCQVGYTQDSRCVDCTQGYQSIADECVSINCIGRASPLPCSGNGTCQVLDFVNDIEGCACQPGFIGRFCDDCDTEKGFSWTNNHTCANKACIGRDGYECAGNGECVHIYEQVFECRCQAGANGKFCHDCNEGFFKLREGKCVFESCISEAQECAGNGHCRQLGLSHRCICEGQFDSETNCKSCLGGYSLVGGRCQEGNGNKLSGGAIAGIVIGVLALLALIVLIVFVAIRRKPTGPSKAKSSATKDTVGGQRFI